MTFAAAKARYREAQLMALKLALEKLSDVLPTGTKFTLMSPDSDEAWTNAWLPNRAAKGQGGWDWPEINSRYAKTADTMRVAMWCGDVLCGLMIVSLNNTAAKVEYIERGPMAPNPLQGRVLIVGLEIAALYAQACERTELWAMNPINESLIDLYVKEYEFEYVTPQKGVTYCRKVL